jgi:release factor glutamine methyltransferase
VTIAEILRDPMLDRADAFALLAHCLQRNKAWLIAHDNEQIPAAQKEHFLALISRKKAGEPVAYLTGKKEFYGRDFFCTPATLVPRPETELLVDLALQCGDALCNALSDSPRVLDLGTGTGCIAISIACERARWRITATDVSAQALEISNRNAHNLGCFAPQVSFVESSWFAQLQGELFDLIVTNPPYIAHNDAHLRGDGVRFEPRNALTDEGDGLSAYRVFASEGAKHLAQRGILLMEHGFEQAAAVAEIFVRAQHWQPVTHHADLAGHLRVTVAQKK